MKKIFLTIIAFFTVSLSVHADPATPFSIKDINGNLQTLSDYKGNIVVLEWFNPGCPFVKKHYESSNMQKLQEKYTAKGVVWLTIDSNAEGKQGYLTTDEAKSLMNEWKIKSTAMILDPTGNLGKTYGAKTTPHLFVIDKNGIIAYQGAIDDKPSASSSSLEGAHNYVAAALDELLAGKSVSTSTTESYGCSIKYGLPS